MKFEDRILKNPRKKILKNIDTGEILNVEIQDDPDNVVQEGTSKNSSFFYDLINEMYPVGKVEMFYDIEDHSNYLGRQWERCSIGRFPVGYSEIDKDFNSAGKQGGNKTHKHLMPIGFDGANFFCDTSKLSNSEVYIQDVKITSNGSEATGSGRFAYTDEISGNPVYEVFSYWRRVE